MLPVTKQNIWRLYFEYIIAVCTCIQGNSLNRENFYIKNWTILSTRLDNQKTSSNNNTKLKPWNDWLTLNTFHRFSIIIAWWGRYQTKILCLGDKQWSVLKSPYSFQWDHCAAQQETQCKHYGLKKSTDKNLEAPLPLILVRYYKFLLFAKKACQTQDTCQIILSDPLSSLYSVWTKFCCPSASQYRS